MTETDVYDALDYFGVKFGRDYARSIAQFSNRLFPDLFYEELRDRMFKYRIGENKMNAYFLPNWENNFKTITNEQKMAIDDIFIENIDFILFEMRYLGGKIDIYNIGEDEDFDDDDDEIGLELEVNLKQELININNKIIQILGDDFLLDRTHLSFFRKIFVNYFDYILAIPQKVKGI